MFADGIVFRGKSKEAETKFESRRGAFEKRGMKVSRNKTEYSCINKNEIDGKL